MNRFAKRFTVLFLLLLLVFSIYALAADSNGILSLYKNHPDDTAPFNVENMFPGDRVPKNYTVSISYSGTVAVNFEIDIKNGSEKLSEVLCISVYVEERDEVLYEGLMAEMPTLVSTCSSVGGVTEQLSYIIDVWLPTSVGNEYQNKELQADFYWWADTQPVNPDRPPVVTDETYSVFYLCLDGMGGYNKFSSLPEGSVHVVKPLEEIAGIDIPEGKEFTSWQVVDCNCDDENCNLVGKTLLPGDELVVPAGNVYLSPVYKDVETPVVPIDPPVTPTYTLTYISGNGEDSVHVISDIAKGNTVTLLDFSHIDSFTLPEGKRFVAWETVFCSCQDEACGFSGKTFLPSDTLVMPEGNIILRAVFEDVPADPSGELIDPPKTGDSSNLFFWIVIMLLCIVIIVLLTRKGAKTEKKENLPRGIFVCIIIIVVLAVALSFTTFALVRSIISVEGHIFRTGEVKINLNDGEPIITADEFLFEPGMTVVKDFFIENESTDPVYYKIYFENIQGGLAEVLDVKISAGTQVLFEGKVCDLVSSNADLQTSVLSVNERRTLQATFHFPSDSRNDTQNLTLSFVLCAQATQTRNNPTREFI